MAEHERAIYADPPGTGKTATTLRWLEGYGRSLIVVPKAIIPQWVEEAGTWFPELTVIRGDGSAQARSKARDALREARGPVALLLNYEALRGDVEALMRIKWEALVCDEAHRLKNRQAQVTKAAFKMAHRVPSVALLTGTPILNRAEELWSLLRICGGAALYSSFWRWADHYFNLERTTFFGRAQTPVTLIHDVKADHVDELRGEAGQYLVQRPLADLLPDLPEAQEIMHPVELSPSERKLYAQMEKYAWAEIDGEILVASNTVSKITRLRQLASEWGSLVDRDEPGSKVVAASSLISDLAPEQVVVLCAYKASVYALANEVGSSAHVYTGDQDSVHREQIVAEFKSGEARVLIGTLAALGEGVDGLQVARHIVLLDRDWTPARNEQAVGRIQRQGQEHDAIFVHHIFALGTIDEMVARTLVGKKRTIAEVLG